VVVGYFVRGLPGALAGALALATPAPLAIPITRLVLKGHSSTLQGACRGIVIASCALMVVTGARMVGDAAPSPLYLGMIVIGAGIMALTRIKPVWVIVVAGIWDSQPVECLFGPLFKHTPISG
jgi:chromate transporter